jgi:predicted  nucleic acid-binding Zn-ribbon protein
MKEEIILKERISLLEKEISTLTEKAEGLEKAIKDMDSLRIEIKAIKIFLGRLHPDFKKEFPEILKKCG